LSRDVKIPGPDHPITVEPTAGRVTVRVGDQVLAETDAALTLRESTYPAVQYVPLADVDETMLRATDTSTYCPFKGDASYYTIIAADGALTDAVWTYATPYPAVESIAGHVAFYPDRVQLSISEPR
jgi:uncharacterized protein (DUF427 family)